MPTFRWQGKARDGTVKSGVMAAANNDAVMAALRAQSIMPTRVRAKGKDLAEYFAFLNSVVKVNEKIHPHADQQQGCQGGNDVEFSQIEPGHGQAVNDAGTE